MDFQDTFQGRRVLVTGDTGFKGSWLCEWLLAEGADVFGLGLPPNTEPSLFQQLGMADRITHRQLDIRDAEKVAKFIQEVQPDFLFHLAAQPLVRLSYEIPVETYATNIMGTVHVLDALRQLDKQCAVVCVTTDKCYENKEWLHSYREEDSMGGFDPYSSSKGACELVIQSYRRSYFRDPDRSGIALASARAGNVIGGGDWALDRIVPDCVRALRSREVIAVRNKVATRPWQHVLEPLGGYMLLAAELWRGLNGLPALQANYNFTALCSAFNFGPNVRSNRTVEDLVLEVLKTWPGSWCDQSDPDAPHEASLLNLSIDKAYHMLSWSPFWGFKKTVEATMNWYIAAESEGTNLLAFTRAQISKYSVGAVNN